MQNTSRMFCQEHRPKDKAVEAPKQKLQNGDQKICEFPSCTTPINIFKMNSSASFCAKHKTEMIFQNARNATKAPIQPAPPEPRPFNKAKLYPLNDEGKTILKEQRGQELPKVKRPRLSKSVSFRTESEEKINPHEPEISKVITRDTKQTTRPFGASPSMQQVLDGTSSPNSRSSAVDHSNRIITNSPLVCVNINNSFSCDC